jgi:O-antigen/teichoic acid export membrane protein
MYKLAQFSLLVFFFTRHTLGVQEVIYSMIFGSIVSILVLARPIINSYRIWGGVKASPEPVIFWVFRHHGKWDILQQFFSNLTSNIQPWVIKTFVSTEAVAIYSIAQTIVSTFMGFFPTKTLGTLVPLRASDTNRMQRIYSYASKYLFLFSIGLAFFSAVITPPVIYFIFPKYLPSLPYFFVLLLWMPANALGAVVSVFLVVLRQQKYLFYQKVLKVIATLPMLALVYFLGLWGLVAYQIVFSFLLFSTAFMFLRSVPPGFKLGWRKFLHFNDDDRQFLETFWKPVLATLRRKLPFLFLFS